MLKEIDASPWEMRNDHCIKKQRVKIMNDIICPSCEKSFKLEEAGYAAIVKQIRDREFDTELQKREQLFEKEKAAAIEVTQLRITMEKDNVINMWRCR